MTCRETRIEERNAPNRRINDELERVELQEVGGISDVDLNYLPARLRRLVKFPEEESEFPIWFAEVDRGLDRSPRV